MDIKMPNLDGIEATRRIIADNPKVKVLMLTTFDADNHVIQALKAGASGYVLKDSQASAIVSSILAVVAGERVMASAVANRVLEMLTGATTPKEFYDGLTAREVEILKMLATGMANKQIALQAEDQREDRPQSREQHVREARHLTTAPRRCSTPSARAWSKI